MIGWTKVLKSPQIREYCFVADKHLSSTQDGFNSFADPETGVATQRILAQTVHQQKDEWRTYLAPSSQMPGVPLDLGKYFVMTDLYHY